MNTVTRNAKTHNTMHPLDIAYRFGAQDARDGDSCVPEMLFTDRERQQAYARGHVSVAGWTLLSASILGREEL